MYIAGKLLNHQPHDFELGVENWEKIADISYKISMKGWGTIIPHDTIYSAEYIKKKYDKYLPHEFWMQQDSSKIRVCDALYFASHSKGADMELKYALDHAMPVYYSVDDVPTVPIESCLLDNPKFPIAYEVEAIEGNTSNV